MLSFFTHAFEVSQGVGSVPQSRVEALAAQWLHDPEQFGEYDPEENNCQHFAATFVRRSLDARGCSFLFNRFPEDRVAQDLKQASVRATKTNARNHLCL